MKKDFKYKDAYLGNETLDECESRSVSRVERMDRMRFVHIIGKNQSTERLHSEIAGAVAQMVSALAISNVNICYLVHSIKQTISFYIGISEQYIQNLKNILNAIYPNINIEEIQQENSLVQNVICMSYGGVVVGYPSDKVNSDSKGVETSFDKLIRGMYGREWTLCICAKAIESGEIHDIRTEIKDEISETSREIQKSLSSEGALHNESLQVTNYEAKIYFDRLNSLYEKVQKSFQDGLWRTAVYYIARAHNDAKQMASIIKGIYGGEDSVPYAIKCLEFSNVEEFFSDGLGLPIDKFNIDERSFLADEMPPFEYFSYKYQNVMPSEILARYLQFPEREVPGFYLNKEMTFDCAPRRSADGFRIGNVAYNGKPLTQIYYDIRLDDFTRHGLINGITGGGKSNTSKYILKELYTKYSVPFLVIESAKQEYYELGRILNISPVVFTLGYEGDNAVPFRINPFEKIEGVPLQLHIDYLLSSFKASFELYSPMPYILETSVYNVYAELGWDVLNDRNTKGRTDYPTLDDLYYEVEVVAEELANGAKWKSDVVASLQARIKSLMIGGKGAMLNTKKSYPIDKLLALPTVLELDSIGDDDVKSFVISMIMVQVYEFRKSQLGNVTKKGLSHVLLIEEAHRLLKNVSTSQGGESANPQGKAVEFFCNMLAEIRSYGQGLLISDQMPTKLAPDVLKNTNLKICHRIVTKEDRELLGSSMNMTSDQVESISMFNTGYAAIYSEGDSRPQLVKLPLVKNINAKTRQQILLESLRQVKNNMPPKQSKKDSSMECSLCTNCVYKMKSENLMDVISPKLIELFVDMVKNEKLNTDSIDAFFQVVEKDFANGKMQSNEKLCLIRQIEPRLEVSKAYLRKVLIDYINM